MTLVSTGITQGCWCVSGHPAHPDFHGTIPSQQVCLYLPPAQRQTTDNLMAPIPEATKVVGRVEWAKDISPAVTGTARTACWEAGGGVWSREVHVTSRLIFRGAFKISQEAVVLIFLHVS